MALPCELMHVTAQQSCRIPLMTYMRTDFAWDVPLTPLTGTLFAHWEPCKAHASCDCRLCAAPINSSVSFLFVCFCARVLVYVEIMIAQRATHKCVRISRVRFAGNSLPRDERNLSAQTGRTAFGLNEMMQVQVFRFLLFLLLSYFDTKRSHGTSFNLRTRELRQATCQLILSEEFLARSGTFGWDAVSFRLFALLSIMPRNHPYCKISTARASERATKGCTQQDEWPFVPSDYCC